MAGTGFTPVYIYASGTTGNVPSASNLTNTTNGSEIALNYFDGKLFYKNSSNSVVTVPLLQSSGSQNGWLSSTDWTTFNGKQNLLVSGSNIKTVGGNSVLGTGDALGNITVSTNTISASTGNILINQPTFGSSYIGMNATSIPYSSIVSPYYTTLGIVGNTPTQLYYNGQLDVRSQESQAADKGGMITLGGYANGTATPYVFGGWRATKTNSTSGDYASTVYFTASDTYSNVNEILRLDGGNIRAFIGGSTTTDEATVLNVRQSLSVSYPSSNGTYFKVVANAANSTVDLTADANNGAYPDLNFITAGGNAARIDANRYLLVGYTTSNGAYKLQVNSQIFATSSTIATSDGRYKENVEDLTGALDMICALQPKTFTWKQGEAADGVRNPNFGKERIVQKEKTIRKPNGDQEIVMEDVSEIDNQEWLREPHNFGQGVQVGFIAQEVQQALADKPFVQNIIKKNVRAAIKDLDNNEIVPESDFYGIAEGNLIALMAAAIKELKLEVDKLKAMQ